MRKKDDLAIDKIMECAKTEFLEKGFEGASMRKVAENAGYTTGMLYGRFADTKSYNNGEKDSLYNYGYKFGLAIDVCENLQETMNSIVVYRQGEKDDKK